MACASRNQAKFILFSNRQELDEGVLVESGEIVTDFCGIPYHSVLLRTGMRRYTGNGVVAGMQKLHYLPTPHTDFVFAVIGEELDALGSVPIVLLFMIVVWRGVHIALPIRNRFGSLLVNFLSGSQLFFVDESLTILKAIKDI